MKRASSAGRNGSVDRFVRMSLLADAYGRLLTENQRKAVELHYGEDLSLGEIAQQFGISRAAVHDTLARAEAALEQYENLLGVVEGAARSRRLAEEALDALDEVEACGIPEAAGEALTRARRALKMLAGEPE